MIIRKGKLQAKIDWQVAPPRWILTHPETGLFMEELYDCAATNALYRNLSKEKSNYKIARSEDYEP